MHCRFFIHPACTTCGRCGLHQERDQQGAQDKTSQGCQRNREPGWRMPGCIAVVLYRRADSCTDRDQGKRTDEKGQEKRPYFSRMREMVHEVLLREYSS